MRPLPAFAGACLLVAGCGATVIETPSVTPAIPRGEHLPVTVSHAPASAPPAPSAPAPSLDALVDQRSLRLHLEALQRIADAHGGNRATATPGFDASVAYVAGVLEEAGHDVERHEFEVDGITSTNLIVEQAGASRDVVMLGAHLDSVVAGPGINDNGSAVAALLVIATGATSLGPFDATVRFAFWGAEEGGPHGSRSYVEALPDSELDRIMAYLNFDMLGSPNAIRFVYDEADAAPGSDALTHLFAASFVGVGLAWEPIDLHGDSDHGPFVEAGIPTGGLFSGGIEPVTDAQAAAFGAVAGRPADRCSHRACDTIDNVDLATLQEMADAIARAIPRARLRRSVASAPLSG